MVDAYVNRKIHATGQHPDPDPDIDYWKKVYGDIGMNLFFVTGVLLFNISLQSQMAKCVLPRACL